MVVVHFPNTHQYLKGSKKNYQIWGNVVMYGCMSIVISMEIDAHVHTHTHTHTQETKLISTEVK